MGASIGLLSDSTRQTLFGGDFELLSLMRDQFLHLRHAPAALSAAFVSVEHIAWTPSTSSNCFVDRFLANSVAIANIHQALPILASESHSYVDQNDSSCKCLAIKIIGGWGSDRLGPSLGRPLPQAMPSQRPYSSLSAQDGASRGGPMARRRSRFHPLTPHLAQRELPCGSKVSGANLRAVPKQQIWTCAEQDVIAPIPLPLNTQRNTHPATNAQGS